MKWKAALTAAALSLLFVGVYGGCNQLTALRPNVPTFYFQWEHWLPFIPAMIVPYMSIDLFFVIAPFLCTTDRELVTYRRRIILCILAAGACFLLFPLKYTFPRPDTPGRLGEVMRQFWKMDLPYNEFPSLHIALRAVMVGTFARHTRGWTRAALHVWFSLIGFSTVLVYQHHVIDILGGFILAGAAHCLFQEEPAATTGNRRIAGYYLAATLLLTAATFYTWPRGLPLLWPAAATAVVAAAYLGAGAQIYRKRNGRLGTWSWLVLWPVMLGQRLSWLWYARNAAPYNRLPDTPLIIGRQLTPHEANKAVATGISAVIDAAGEFSEAPALRALPYLQLPLLDLTAPTPAQLQQALDFIDTHAPQGPLYIHCKAGYSRTAAIAGAWLLHTRRAATAEDAIAQMRAARPTLIVRPEALAALKQFHSALTHPVPA